MQEIHTDIKKIRIALNLTQDELAKELQVSKQYLSNVEKGIKKLNQNKFEKLIRLYNKAGFVLEDKNFINIDYLEKDFLRDPKGFLTMSTPVTEVQISASLLKMVTENDSYVTFPITTDAMFPTIKKGSRVILKYSDYDKSTDSDIYAFYYKENFYIRRIYNNISEFIISADNKEYKPIILKEEEMEKLEIVGKIEGIIF